MLAARSPEHRVSKECGGFGDHAGHVAVDAEPVPRIDRSARTFGDP